LDFKGFTDDEDDDSFDTPAAAAINPVLIAANAQAEAGAREAAARKLMEARTPAAREAAAREAAREAAATAVTAVCAQPPAAAPADDDVCVFAKRSLDAIFDGINKRYKMEHEQREKARDIELQEEKKRYMAVVTLHCARLAEACIEAFNAGGKASVKAVCAAIFARAKQQMKNVE
jgi:hypothetical protein